MNSIKKFLKSLNIKEYYKKLNGKTEFFEPTLIITLTLLFALVVIAGMKHSMGETNTVISSNRAEEYIYDGKYDEAISEYEKMQSGEEWPSYKLKIAGIYSLKGDFQKSNSLLKEVIVIRDRLMGKEISKYIEKDREFINEVVFTFYMNGEFGEAITLGEDYLKNVESYKPLVRILFAAYLSSGQVDKAKDIIENYSLDEKSAYDLSEYSKMQMMLGNFDDGLITLKKAWEKNEDEVNTFEVINEVSYYDRDEMINKIKKLSEENSDEIFYKILMAKVYSSSEETVGLVDEILNSVDDNISFVNVNIIKAQAYMSENRDSEAKKVIEKVIENNKDSYLTDYLKSWIYHNEEDYLQAYEYAKKSIIANEDYDNAWGLLIPQIMISWGKVDGVEAYLRVALSKDPINYNMILRIAEYYKDVKVNYDKAKEYYSLALGINPNKEEIYYILASIEMLRGNYEGAAEALENAVSTKTTDSKYYRNLGYVYMQLGKNEEAIESFRNAYSLNENDVLALNNAACYYFAIENDIWRGYSNIEAAYNDMPADLDEESKLIIEENYNKAKVILDDYIESEETILNIPEFKYSY